MTKDQHRRTSETVRLALLLAAAAGSIEAYSIAVLNAFAGAQTGNVVLGSIALSQGEWSAVGRYVWPILAFIAGVMMAQTLLTDRLARAVHRPYRVLLGVEILTLIVIGLLPEQTPKVIVSIVITVIVAAQASTFRTLVDIGYNSAFTTGNLMNAITAAHAGLMKHDHASLVHARRVGRVIASYAVGAVAGAFCVREFGHRGIWLAAVVLILALVLFITDQREGLQSQPE
ncbi:MAG: hypothetical protein JWM76_1457 [Pseudonocardiales bacterium]|nr:hypothetical protein [Pseudonocardiales bacterium]